jgi:NAD(P)-dependent dehydrogenase (short-subunit alcohol dehydrogenase family)
MSERPKMIPLGRLAVPEDIASAVAFLASDEAAYMTGQAINVTGGLWLH